jgi:hypothetical protein
MKQLPATSAIGNIHIGTIAGKLNGVMPATTPSGLRGRTGKLNHFEAAGELTLGVRDDLAVLGSDHGDDRVGVLFRQLLELEHDAGAGEGRRVGPARKGFLRVLDRGIEFGGTGERNLGLDLAGRRIEHVGGTARCASHFLAADIVIDRPHCRPLQMLK